MRGIIIVILLFNGICMEGRTSASEQRRLLKNHDLTNILPIKNKYKDSPQLYWEYVRDHNKQYQEALKAAKKGKAREAQQAIGEAIGEIRRSYNQPLYFEGISELLDSVKAGSGISELFPFEAKLYCDPVDYPNACALPDGTVYITYGIMKRLGFDYNLIMAVYAHELAHFVLQHSFCHIYFTTKKIKKNKILSEIFSVISVSAAAYGDISMASTGVDTRASMTRSAIRISNNVEMAAQKDAIAYKMRYNREQEYEADILAYRFLEAIGIDGDCYIKMLKSIMSDLEVFSNDESTHPLTEDRIALIELMRNNPKKIQNIPDPLDDDIYFNKDEF